MGNHRAARDSRRRLVTLGDHLALGNPVTASADFVRGPFAVVVVFGVIVLVVRMFGG